MPLTRKKPRRRIEADPSGTRQIHLAPGMQIREIVFGARWAVDRLLIGFELNQITRDKPGRHPKLAQRLDHQPGRIPTRTRTERECLLRRLHPGLEPDQVTHILLNLTVQVDQKINRAPPRTVNTF